jgi:hypothetical protein
MSHTIRDRHPLSWKQNNRDGKPPDKPTKTFKQVKRSEEKAKVKQAVRVGKEIPRYRKHDVYEYL